MIHPVTVLTGFLGSGKSTLLNRLLMSPEMSDAAVIINEFGEIPIDHVLVNESIENAMVLQSGCICCTIRGDLIDTLLDLEAKRETGAIPAFRRVVIETTGLADVAPILQTLLFDEAIAGRYEVSGVVTTVDSVSAGGQVKRFEEVRRQIAFADAIALTKTDLADADQVEAAKKAIHDLNPAARIFNVVNGETDHEALLRKGDRRIDETDMKEWLAADAYEHLSSDPHHGHDHGHEHGHGDHRHDPSRHGESIRSYCFTWDEPLDFPAFKSWLLALTSLHGQAFLRIKGIVAFRQFDGPVVFQGVQHVLYPPKRLKDWPDADHSSRMVFITEGVAPAALQATMPELTPQREAAG